MGFRDDRDEARRRTAREALARVAGEGEIFASSGLSPTGAPVADRTARSEPAHDPVEIWGKRIGRGLGIAFALGLVVHLVTTYGIK